MRVEHVMGMPWTVRNCGDGDPAALDEVFAELARIDACFSPFIDGSPISRIGRDELSEAGAGAEVGHVLDLCRLYERVTGGYFSAWANGRLDPCGLVKGWAIDRACEILDRHGHRDYAVDAAGDVRCRGHRGDGTPWRVGIRHPVERGSVVRVVLAADRAVATSGTYERGPHIHDPHTGRPATELLSMTVTGPDIVEADVLATAAFAMGKDGIAFIESMPGVDAYAIDTTLTATWTSGFDALCE